jgi:hypothetical protein
MNKLATQSYEKIALLGGIGKVLSSPFKQFANSFSRNYVKPFQTMSKGDALKDIAKKTFLPVEYSKGLKEVGEFGLENATKDIAAHRQKLKGMGVKAPLTEMALNRYTKLSPEAIPTHLVEKGITPAALKEMKKLKSTYSSRTPYIEQLEKGKALEGKSFTEKLKYLSSSPSKWQATKDVGKMLGHYGGETAGLGLTYSYPVMGAVGIANSPDGNKAEQAGSLIGETAALAMLTPMGRTMKFLPSILGTTALSSAGSTIGGAAGKGVDKMRGNTASSILNPLHFSSQPPVNQMGSEMMQQTMPYLPPQYHNNFDGNY